MELSESTVIALKALCKSFHQYAKELGAEYLSRAGRHTYTTPASYIELLSTFSKLYTEKTSEISAARDRYIVGLEKIQSSADQVRFCICPTLMMK